MWNAQFGGERTTPSVREPQAGIPRRCFGANMRIPGTAICDESAVTTVLDIGRIAHQIAPARVSTILGFVK